MTNYPSNFENKYKLHPDAFTQINHIIFLIGSEIEPDEIPNLLDAIDALSDILATVYHPDKPRKITERDILNTLRGL